MKTARNCLHHSSANGTRQMTNDDGLPRLKYRHRVPINIGHSLSSYKCLLTNEEKFIREVYLD